MAVATAEEREEPNQVEQQADHGRAVVSGSARQINHLAAGRSFGEGQGPYVGSRIAGLPELSIPWLSELPVLGPIAFRHDALVYAAVPVAA